MSAVAKLVEAELCRLNGLVKSQSETIDKQNDKISSLENDLNDVRIFADKSVMEIARMSEMTAPEKREYFKNMTVKNVLVEHKYVCTDCGGVKMEDVMGFHE